MQPRRMGRKQSVVMNMALKDLSDRPKRKKKTTVGKKGRALVVTKVREVLVAPPLQQEPEKIVHLPWVFVDYESRLGETALTWAVRREYIDVIMVSFISAIFFGEPTKSDCAAAASLCGSRSSSCH
jgi:hypothetical protein